MIARIALCAALALSLTACGNRPVISSPPARCSSLIPDGWSEGVEATPVPDNAPALAQLIGRPLTAEAAAQIIAPWASAYLMMGSQLQKANGRTADTVQIVQRCEEMVNAARD